MQIGIPHETKDHERRVALTPAAVAALVSAGHAVHVESGAGARIAYADDDFRAAGAGIVSRHEDAYAADLVVKVKEPQPDEYPLLRPGLTLFCYLHLASAPDLARILLHEKVTGIAFETVRDATGAVPLLRPMSQIAGRLAVQAGAWALEMQNGGRGVLLGGVPGVPPGRVAVLGGGTVGSHAAQMAVGLGADVTLLDRSAERLERFDVHYRGRLKTRFSSAANIADTVTASDLVIGATYIVGARTPRLLPRDLVAAMPPGSVLVDVSIDQGGVAETSRPTTHSDPVYLDAGVVHYCVTNMPAAVARTATEALSASLLPYVLALANHGWRDALARDPGFREGLNTLAGAVTHAGVAEALGLPLAPTMPPT